MPPVRTTTVLFVLLIGVALAVTIAAQSDPSRGDGSSTIARDNTGGASDRVAVPEPSEKAIEYYRSGNVLWIVDSVWGLLVPAVFLFAGFSGRIQAWAERRTRRWILVVVLYFVAFSAITFVVDLPLAYYEGFVRQHAYGLSNQTLTKWATDQTRSLAVGIVLGALFLWVPYLLLRRSPRRWWLYTGLLTVPFLVIVVLVQPVWIDPLFNRFGPMQNKDLETKILALADRAGIDDGRVFEVAKSEDTNAVNAYVNGFGATKRIVLWDTAIAKLNERELLFVMGHEMGHYVLGHVWQLILFYSALVLATLYVIHRTAGWLLSRYRERFGFERLADVASLPLLILLFSVYTLIVTPAALAFARHLEHEADRFGLEITRDNHAAATAFVKLQQENLAVPRPGWLYRTFRSDHPVLGERVDFCNDYRPWDRGEPLVYDALFRTSR
jgi:Zn-dependent protease with chaperone function